MSEEHPVGLTSQSRARTGRACAHAEVSALGLAHALRQATQSWKQARAALATALYRGGLALTTGTSLAGHLCEVCLDAHAVQLRPAPWGGDMGVCAACAAPVVKE